MHKGIFQNKITGTWFIDTKIKIGGKYCHCTIRRDEMGVSYPTKKAANDDYDRAVCEWIKKNNVDCQIVTIKKLCDKFNEWRSTTNEYGTRQNDFACINLRIIPFFGKDTPVIKAFTGDNMLQFYSKIKTSEEISNGVKIKTITKIRKILDFARMRRYITTDIYDDCIVFLDLPALRKMPNNAKHHDTIAWTDDEFKKVINSLDTSTRLGLMYRVFFFCGTRISEFLGIKCSDVDFDKNRIYIRHQAVYEGTGRISDKEQLKTGASNRSLLMSQEISTLLKNYIQDLDIQQDDHLFFKEGVYSKSSFRRQLYKIEENAGVRKNVPHGVRHTNTTNILEHCTTIDQIKAVAIRNGHSVDTCLKVYQNIHEKSEKDILTILEKSL